jgi:hypothetical protein
MVKEASQPDLLNGTCNALSAFEAVSLEEVCRAQPSHNCIRSYGMLLENATERAAPCRIGRLRARLCSDATKFLSGQITPNSTDTWSRNIAELGGHLSSECLHIDEYNMRFWEPSLFNWPAKSTRPTEWARRLAHDASYASRWQARLKGSNRMAQGG